LSRRYFSLSGLSGGNYGGWEKKLKVSSWNLGGVEKEREVSKFLAVLPM
jgi:hypothetical protein